MRTRSLFWPFVFIATGVVWLLVQLRTIPVENLWALMYIWPFVLMAVGVGLILRARWPITRMFVSGLVVLGMVLAILFAPQLGWNKAPAWNFITINGITGSVAGSGVDRHSNPSGGRFQCRGDQLPRRVDHPARRNAIIDS